MGSCELILLQQFVLILSFTIHQSWSHQCQNVDAIRGYRLVNHVLQTVHDVSFERCAVLCTEHPDCYSINHFTTTSTCELNSKTKLWFLSDFIPSDSVFYMDMLVRQYDPCVTEQPCKNDQDAKCLQYPSNTTVQCKCSRHYIGKNCEKFAPLQKGGNVTCSGQTLDLCQTNMTAWQATILGPTSLSLSGCSPDDVTNTAELLLFVSQARTDSQGDYGKYQIVRVKENTGCNVTLLTPINMTLSDTPCELIAQRLPYFDHISLTQSCQVTCCARSGAVGGILALRATKLTIDSTSKIHVNGKGFHGGAGGSSSGGGGFGGETFVCLSSTYGKGGDRGQPGDHGGGAGDGASRGPGGLNAGGGGGDSSSNPDDGGGGGGGGGHFSGGGGGGGATGSGLTGGYGGVASDVIGTAAGGGGISFGGNVNGHNGGQTGETDGTSTRGGKGGYSEHHGYGGGGGGGGFQYGNVDFNTRISYGGGGGGGGGSQHGFVGGKGGNGGGLVLLFLDQLTLNGAIEAKGDPGSCPSNNVAFRAAPGGGGAGGSVVIFTQELLSNVNGKIFVQGGVRKKCVSGAGGGAGGGIGRWVVKTPSSLTKSDVSIF